MGFFKSYIIFLLLLTGFTCSEAQIRFKIKDLRQKSTKFKLELLITNNSSKVHHFNKYKRKLHGFSDSYSKEYLAIDSIYDKEFMGIVIKDRDDNYIELDEYISVDLIHKPKVINWMELGIAKFHQKIRCLFNNNKLKLSANSDKRKSVVIKLTNLKLPRGKYFIQLIYNFPNDDLITSNSLAFRIH